MATTQPILATFRVVYCQGAGRYIALAWNYDAAVLIATRDHATYTDARDELTATAAERGVTLRWFDGEYLIPAGSDQMVNVGSVVR